MKKMISIIYMLFSGTALIGTDIPEPNIFTMLNSKIFPSQKADNLRDATRELFSGIKHKNHKWITNAFRQGFNVHARDNKGRTPLHWAIKKNNTGAATSLISYESDVNARDCKGITPLHWATSTADTRPLKILILFGADINAQDCKGRTPLHWAARMNNIDATKILIRFHANINAKDSLSLTPLNLSLYSGNHAVTEVLSRHGATANNKSVTISAKIYVSLIRGNIEKAKSQIANGVNVNDAESIFGYTALHLAAVKQNKDLIKMLIAYGANIKTEDDCGFTPLDSAPTDELKAQMIQWAKTKKRPWYSRALAPLVSLYAPRISK